MKRNLLNAFVLAALLLTACSKSKTPGPTTKNPPDTPKKNYKFEIESGNNQTARVGDVVPDLVKVKLSGDAIDLGKFLVEYKGSGCNSDLILIGNFNASGEGLDNYRLAGNVGAQTLQATLIEKGTVKRIDSLTFNFTATASTTGLNLGACVPFEGAVSLCKTGTGRLFAVFGSSNPTYLRFSDDDGISWNPVNGFNSAYSFLAVRSDGKNGVMAYSGSQGMYYSADNGATWKLKTVPFQGAPYHTMSYTPTGKSFFNSQFGTGSLYYSPDNGTTWSELNVPHGNGLYTPQEGPNGEFYVFAANEGIYKSMDEGATWTKLPFATGTSVDDASFAFYVDYSNGWIYKSTQRPTNGIYLSKDGGQTYTRFFDINTIVNAFYVNNGVMYIENSNNISKIDDPNHFTTLYTELIWTADGDFIVSNSGNVLWKSSGPLNYIKP